MEPMMTSSTLLSLLLAGFAWHAAHAATLYKWRDTAGHVTYSSRPPPAGIRAERMTGAPPPDAEALRQAEARAKKAQALATEMEAARRQQEAEDARRRAMLPPPAPLVIEKPVYVPQPVYYPPVRRPPRHHRDKPSHERPR
jgi:Domain of unknown function (DUF4124)